jgi:CheY-like chemotaxis protein
MGLERDGWPTAEGEAAQILRNMDWGRSPLGLPSSWPPALRLTVDIALRSPCAVAVLWGEEAIALYNDAFALQVGGHHPALLGSPLLEGWPEAAEENRRALDAALREGRSVVSQAGTALSFSPIFDGPGAPVGVIAIAGEALAEDTSPEAGEDGAALRLTRKLAAFGQLGGSLAHEFNNLLQAIIGSLELVQARVARGRTNEIDRFVQNSISAANRAAALTHRLAAFSRSQTLLTNDSDPDRRARAKRALHGEVVLVVEDDAVVRGLITEVLDELGYLALEAADGVAAAKILESPSPIDLLITDIGLPGINGWQVAEAAHRVRPGLKVLFMSGYADAAETPSAPLGSGMQVMTKPFAIETLMTRIRAMIEGP